MFTRKTRILTEILTEFSIWHICNYLLQNISTNIEPHGAFNGATLKLKQWYNEATTSTRGNYGKLPATHATWKKHVHCKFKDGTSKLCIGT